jgi:DUF971 family protein
LLPVEIKVQKSKKQLRIKWENGEIKVYSFHTLRSNCPCADCQLERENVSQSNSPDQLQLQIPLTLVESNEIVHVELIGNYALKLFWKDGHYQGIFSWETLYELPAKTEPGMEN